MKNLKGTKVGSLEVLGKVPTPTSQKQRWKCRCVCGKEIVVRHDYLIHTNSPKTHCGCLNKGPSVLHHDEYHIWNAMLQRCQNPKVNVYPNYGGRGIKVCPEWQTFEGFFTSMGKRPGKEYSLDRINPDGNYEPGNVRWATDKQQARNKRNTIYVPHPTESGKLIPAGDAAEILGLSYGQLRYRYIKEGKWPTTPTTT